ncbi:hypothetical protein VKT23_008117 [Stygiomarasmius scandens]|uniref:Methyltransferase type 11 domain-containing protein n=1 Tax=Marasmiellus scandens TaxID=2682957 RepID=A0ABR1JNG7_9AGAR
MIHNLLLFFPPPPLRGMATVHEQSAKGYSDKSSEYYDKARPSYPLALYSYIRQTVGINKKSLNVIEIGSGTGIFTRGLLNHLGWHSDIAELKAIEPSAGMREIFSKNIIDDEVNVSVSEGTFDSTGAPGKWADMIVIATAFHWCLDFDKAVSEFCRILKPDGFVFLVWNSLSSSRAPWITKLWNISNRYDSEGFVTTERWRLLYESQLYKQRMRLLEEQVFEHDQVATADTVIRRVFSWSAIAPLCGKEKDKVREEIMGILEDRGKSEGWVDESAGVFKLPHDSLVIAIRMI